MTRWMYWRLSCSSCSRSALSLSCSRANIISYSFWISPCLQTATAFAFAIFSFSSLICCSMRSAVLPSALSLISLGKARWICRQRSLSTKVLLFEAVLDHVDIRMRHMGHKKFVLSVMPLKQERHSSCLQGSTTGSTRISRQIGHVQSLTLILRSLEDCCTSLLTVALHKSSPDALDSDLILLDSDLIAASWCCCQRWVIAI